MKSFISLALVASAFAAPITKRTEVPLDQVVGLVENLVSDVTAATGKINATLASPVDSTAKLADVQVGLSSITNLIENVISVSGTLNIAKGTADSVIDTAGNTVGIKINDLISEIQGTVSGITASGLDVSSLTGTANTLVSDLTGLTGTLKNLGLTSVVSTLTNLVGGITRKDLGLPSLLGPVTNLLGNLPIVGQTVSSLGSLSSGLGSTVLGGIVRRDLGLGSLTSVLSPVTDVVNGLPVVNGLLKTVVRKDLGLGSLTSVLTPVTDALSPVTKVVSPLVDGLPVVNDLLDGVVRK